MQKQYFSLWLGKWTTAIDWTAAVMGTYVSATLSSLSNSIDYIMPGTFDSNRKMDIEAQMVENEINKYFGQSAAFYYGEDAFAIRLQAYDDILWVVLGWLESIQFIESHSKKHYATSGVEDGEWHAQQFIPVFAHRARVFYELAEKGWDWRLCGGGLTWNPRLLPYKNAITNELFISASVSMYLNFPGDSNCSPLLSPQETTNASKSDLDGDCDGKINRRRYDSTFLTNAKNGYDWLKNSGMANAQGLYTDGFHISGYKQNHSKTTCDERNEMVYTYNQGVVLSGLRNLWEATGNITFLEDGHELVRNVIRATGWKDRITFADPDEEADDTWHGLGSNGILTEACDPSGTCNQNGQTFKGIFFHHLTTFCTPLPLRPVTPGYTQSATRELAALHERSCESYTEWVVHNAQAALRTRDAKGRFGAWWAARHHASFSSRKRSVDVELPDGAIDYRNHPSLLVELDIQPEEHAASDESILSEAGALYTRRYTSVSGDLNDRGRGRTVETQGSGLSVVRAMWEFLRRREGAGVSGDV